MKMATVPRESLQIEPAVKAKGANRDLTQKNNRAVNNWQKVKSALEREKKAWTKGAEEDRSKLLKHREKLRKTSLTLTRNDSLHSEEEFKDGISKPLVSLKEVYEALMNSAAIKQQQDDGVDIKSVRSEPAAVLTTHSFEQKRVGRKPISFSLFGLQQANSNLQTKLKAIEKARRGMLCDTSDQDALETRSEPAGPFDLNEEEKQLGPTLKLPPQRLPPITRSVSFKPSVRTYNKDEKYRQRVKGKEFSTEEIRYCRYLRKRSCSDPPRNYHY